MDKRHFAVLARARSSVSAAWDERFNSEHEGVTALQEWATTEGPKVIEALQDVINLIEKWQRGENIDG